MDGLARLLPSFVFQLKPYKNDWFWGFAPYYALNYGYDPSPSVLINAETGEPWAAPPP